MQNTDNLSSASDQPIKKRRFTHPRISRGNRHPLSLLKQVLAEIQAQPDKLDNEIAEKLNVRTGVPIGLRLLLTRRRDLLERVLSGELSLGKACELMRQRQTATATTPTPTPAPDLVTAFSEPKLRADLLAWCALTRELLDSIEKTLNN
jgi:hypothetical protein